MDLYEILTAIVDALAAEGIDYAVCGGIAVALHGFPRFTEDIDLLILEDDVARAVAALQPLGFRFAALPMTFDAGTDRERRIQRVTRLEEGVTLTLDLIVVGPGTTVAWDTRIELDWDDRTLPVVSRQGLAAMKRVAGRPKDLIDLDALGLDDDE